MAEPQSMTCASPQKLQRALGLGAQTLKRFVPIKPNRMGQLECPCCFYLDRPMTNPQGACKRRRLADTAVSASPAERTTVTRTSVTPAAKRFIAPRRPQARRLSDVRGTGPIR